MTTKFDYTIQHIKYFIVKKTITRTVSPCGSFDQAKIDVVINGEKVTTINEQGTVFGEMALLLNEKRTATLKSRNNVVLNRITKKDLKGADDGKSGILQEILKFSPRGFRLVMQHKQQLIWEYIIKVLEMPIWDLGLIISAGYMNNLIHLP